MEDKIYWGYLYDFYGELLNEHRRSIFESYVIDDLSLSEIAEIQGITRQGAHDVIKRSIAALEEYESKLKLLERFLAIKENAENISKLCGEKPTENIFEEIKSLSDSIVDKL